MPNTQTFKIEKMERPIIFTKEAKEMMTREGISEATGTEIMETGERERKGSYWTARKVYGDDDITLFYRLKHSGKFTVLGGWKRPYKPNSQ